MFARFLGIHCTGTNIDLAVFAGKSSAKKGTTRVADQSLILLKSRTAQRKILRFVVWSAEIGFEIYRAPGASRRETMDVIALTGTRYLRPRKYLMPTITPKCFRVIIFRGEGFKRRIRETRWHKTRMISEREERAKVCGASGFTFDYVLLE